MKRTVIACFCASFALACSASHADGRGPQWQPAANLPFDWSCGNTIVHVSFPVNRAFVLTTVLTDGTTLEKFTGYLTAELDTDSGASISVNASGPGRFIFPTSGPIEVIAAGHQLQFLTQTQSQMSGLPQIFVSTGNTDQTFFLGGPITFKKLNSASVVDICKALGA